MKLCGDKIQFEYRSELHEIMKMIEKYIETYPEEKNNEVIKEFYGKVDTLDMTW